MTVSTPEGAAGWRDRAFSPVSAGRLAVVIELGDTGPNCRRSAGTSHHGPESFNGALGQEFRVCSLTFGRVPQAVSPSFWSWAGGTVCLLAWRPLAIYLVCLLARVQAERYP
jgi:hypothetical protein